MVRILIVILILTFSSDIFSQYAMHIAKVEPSETSVKEEVPAKLMRKFKRDAARIALRLDSSVEDLRFHNISISPDKMNQIFEILKSVYLSGETGKAISRCNVHTFPNPSIDQIKIIYDNTVEWAELLNEGISETTNEAFNDLLDEYDLVIENHEKWTDEQDILVIRSSQPLNMAALANEFYNIEGIEEIDLGIPDIQGNDIVFSRSQDGWEIKYILNIGGSLLDIEKKKHLWIFEVSDEGDVRFLNEEGEPIPEWMKCESEYSSLARG